MIDNPAVLLVFSPLQHPQDTFLVGQAFVQLFRDRLEEALRIVVHLRRFGLIAQVAVLRHLLGTVLEDRAQVSIFKSFLTK